MSAIIKANPQLPAAIAKLVSLATPQAVNEFAGGVTSGFPIISYKGKVWRIRKGGEEQVHMDAEKNALPTIDIVLVQGNPNPSKIFYDKKFEEGTTEAPRCFSNNGSTPDPSVQNPISKLCVTCPNNVWGSRITDNGKKSRACSDARRMAVVFADDLNEKGIDCHKLLLRVPPASLNPLKDYVEKQLAPKGIPPFAIVTRIGFDVQAAHPQFTFKAQRFLNEDEAEAIIQLRDSEDIKRILAEANDFPAGGAGDAPGETSPTPVPAQGGTPAPAQAATTPPAGKQAKMRPASEEEAGLDLAALGTQPAAAAPAETIAPAPAPKARKPTKAATPPPAAPVEEEEEAPAAPAKAGNGATPENFDDLLSSILDG